MSRLCRDLMPLNDLITPPCHSRYSSKKNQQIQWDTAQSTDLNNWISYNSWRCWVSTFLVKKKKKMKYVDQCVGEYWFPWGCEGLRYRPDLAISSLLNHSLSCWPSFSGNRWWTWNFDLIKASSTGKVVLIVRTKQLCDAWLYHTIAGHLAIYWHSRVL